MTTPPAAPGSHLLSAASRGATSSAIRDLLEHARRPGMISLAGGLPAASLFPTERLVAAAATVLADPANLQYGLTEGDVELRTLLAGRQRRRDGRSWTPDDVQVVSGSQQALDLLAKVLIDPGDPVVVGDPDYLGALAAFGQHRAELVGVPVDEHGLDVAVLAERLRAGLVPKCVYVVTEFHNPTGATMSVERLTALAELADHYGFLVVEDNPYGALRFEGEPAPPLASMTDNVAALGTFSKTLAPGLRVAWMIGPRWLGDAVRVAKQSTDLHTSTVTQRLAVELLGEPGWYDRHIAGLVPHYRERRNALCAAIAEGLPGARFAVPAGGMFLWVTLPGGIATTELLAVALDHGVAYVPGVAFAVTEPAPHSLRLSFATASPDELRDGVARLAAAIGEHTGR